MRLSYVRTYAASDTAKTDYVRLALSFLLLAALLMTGLQTSYAVTISNTPLYLGSSALPNVLLTLSNAQNMDENGNPANGIPIGAAIGGSSPDSKSEIARGVIRNIASSYIGQINLGLMSFQQTKPKPYYIYNSFYDASYNPANYQPTPAVAKSATLKNYEIANPDDPTNYIYYNWASPFYDNTSPYSSQFCYSDTAKFDNSTNVQPTMPYDIYRCFNTKTGTSDGIASPLQTGNVATKVEQGYGYSGSMNFQGEFAPSDSDYATNTLDFGAQIASVYTATAWFSNTSPGGGYLQVPVLPLNAAQVTAIDNKLTCNLPTAPTGAPNANPTPTSGACNSDSSPTSSSILNAGLTAIEGTINANQVYLSGGTNSEEGFATNALPNSCNKNFSVLLTNGLPSVTALGSITDICALTSQAVAAATKLYNSGVKLYVVGYTMLPQALQNYTTICNNSVNPLDQIASAGGTSASYSASDPVTLQTTLNSVINTIVKSAGSSSALTSGSASINSNSYIYQTSYNSADWSGHLKAYVETATGPSSTVAWDAAQLIPAPTSRAVYTSSGGVGVAFSWVNLSADEQCYLAGQASGCTSTQAAPGQNVLNYLLGQAISGYRTRTTPLGDIIDSNPLYLSTEDYGYSILPSTEGSTYATYVQSKATNNPMIYVGANDGMLHGFNATSGVETFAYVPSTVYPHLPDLTSTTYKTSHEYFVDGTPASGDAYYSSAWHTILLGTLGATSGTNALFAMDISNPGSITASSLLWEVTDANDLGNTWGQGAVARFNDGNYYAVVNNGYNSVNKHAVLFLVQVNKPSNIIKLDTGVGGGTVDNGLSQPALLDVDSNGTIDAIYAGDLQGDVWKFDVSSAMATNWNVAYVSSGTKQPLFKARDALGNIQPITAPIQLGSIPSGATGTAIVYFGTGQYLNTPDITNLNTQSMYGVLDSSTFSGMAFSGGTSNYTRATAVANANVVVQQSIVYEDATTRAVTSNTVNYAGGQLGWYLDLLQPPLPGTQQGERVINKAIIRSGRVLFSTLIPASGTCSYGGSGWVMEVDAASGGEPSQAFLDLFGNGQYDSVTLSSGVSAAAVGSRITNGFGSMPLSTTNGSVYSTSVSTSSGNIQLLPNALITTGNPRVSWSQIK